MIGRLRNYVARGLDRLDPTRRGAELGRCSSLFEISHDMLCTVNSDGVVERLNGVWTETLGWSEAELRSRPFVEFVHPDDRERIEQKTAGLASGGVAVDFSIRYATKDGGWRWIDWKATVAPQDGLIYASARDITSRKLADLALEAAEHRARQLLEAAHVSERLLEHERRQLVEVQSLGGIGSLRSSGRHFELTRDLAVTSSDDGFFKSVNPAVTHILGWSAEEFLARPFLDMVHPDDRASTLAEVAKQADGQVTFNFTNRYLAKDGSYRWLDWNSIMPPDEPLMYASARDITERTLMEEALRDAEAVRISSDALMAVINDVLDFSKIEAGKLAIETEPFELRPVVQDVASIVATAAHAKGIELVSWIDLDLPTIFSGDGNRIRQVLINLMTNAVKFTAQGEVAVNVTGKTVVHDRMLLRFEVRDTGIGIEETSFEKIFDSFAQQDGSTTRRYGGTGLGLSISRQLVELMGGEIGVQSVPGAGSTFWFTASVRVIQDRPQPLKLTEFSGVRVLVVDDNATNLMILERQLTAWGLSCDTASDPTAVPELLQAAANTGQPYRLAVVDSRMPLMTGNDLTHVIRSTRSTSALPVLMLTSSRSGRAAAADAGVDGFLTKPVHATRLFDEIARTLGARKPATPVLNAPALAVQQPNGGSPDGPAILVAEDNLINQRVATALLTKRGYRIDLAANGREAVEKYTHGSYQAIFMDCQMPTLDGYDATAEIRRHEGADSHIPIIAMTANTMTGDRERCLAAGMDDYIGKPIRSDTLDQVIARALPDTAGGVPDLAAMQIEGPSDELPLFEASLLDEVCGDDKQARA